MLRINIKHNERVQVGGQIMTVTHIERNYIKYTLDGIEHEAFSRDVLR